MKHLLAIIMLLSSSGAMATLQDDAVTSIAHKVILQDYTDLASRARDLSDAIKNLANSPNQQNLELAQQAWRDTRMPWETSEAFLFGPVSALGIDPGIDTWPVNKVDLQAVLNSGRELNTEFVKNLGANLQGFHTIEYLLFGEGATANKKTIQEMTKKDLEYLQSTSSLLADNTQILASAWSTHSDPNDNNSPAYVDIIANPGPSNPNYPSAQSVIIEYVNGINKILDEVANGKISDPLGSDIQSANTSLEESPFSWNSLADFSNNIRSALYVYTGDYRANPGVGINDIVAITDPQLAKQVEIELRTSIKMINDIAGPEKISFRQAILNEQARLRIKAAIDQINKTRLLIENKVLPILQK